MERIEIDLSGTPISEWFVLRLLTNTVRLRVHRAQWIALKAGNIYQNLPIVIDDQMPRDQIQWETVDGEILGLLFNAAIPTGFEPYVQR